MKIYTEQEVYQKLSFLCSTTEYCLADMQKKAVKYLGAEAEEVVERILQKLVAERFIDEARYARAFVRDKFRYNRWGRVRIQQELRMRRIPSEIIDEALVEIPEDDNLDTLKALIDGKRRTVKGKSEYEVRNKLIRFALSRGFEMGDVLKVVGDNEYFD